ncbi:MAG: serine protease [Actinobacteria bacterium]|nr:serine protease [Actinomycetota bacterium]
MTSWRDRIFGSESRLGWWVLPLFIGVGFVGAILAGALTVVYYSQQVAGLRTEIRDTAARLDTAVEEVEEARADAVDEITEQLDAVRDALARGAPIDDAAAVGIVSLRAILAPIPAPEPTTQDQSSPPPPADEGEAQGAVMQDPTEPPGEGEPSPTETSTSEPPPPPPPRPVRTGTGFAVVRDGATTFFVTTFSLVTDPNGPNGVAPDVELTLDGRVIAGEVHSWDTTLDIALIRADAGQPTVSEWRPQAEPVAVGDRLFAVALTDTGATTEIAATVAAVEPRALLTDLLPPAFVLGGPLVDLDGRIVAIVTATYQPFGETPEGQTAVSIAVLCEQLLRCGPEQLGTEQPTEEG